MLPRRVPGPPHVSPPPPAGGVPAADRRRPQPASAAGLPYPPPPSSKAAGGHRTRQPGTPKGPNPGRSSPGKMNRELPSSATAPLLLARAMNSFPRLSRARSRALDWEGRSLVSIWLGLRWRSAGVAASRGVGFQFRFGVMLSADSRTPRPPCLASPLALSLPFFRSFLLWWFLHASVFSFRVAGTVRRPFRSDDPSSLPSSRLLTSGSIPSIFLAS